MPIHCLELGCIGLYIPSDSKISLASRDVPLALPSGHLLVVRDVQPNTSLLSAVYRYNLILILRICSIASAERSFASFIIDVFRIEYNIDQITNVFIYFEVLKTLFVPKKLFCLLYIRLRC